MAKSILIFTQKLTFSQKNLMISTKLINSLQEILIRKTCGLLNHIAVLREKEFSSLMI